MGHFLCQIYSPTYKLWVFTEPFLFAFLFSQENLITILNTVVRNPYPLAKKAFHRNMKKIWQWVKIFYFLVVTYAQFPKIILESLRLPTILIVLLRSSFRSSLLLSSMWELQYACGSFNVSASILWQRLAVLLTLIIIIITNTASDVPIRVLYIITRASCHQPKDDPAIKIAVDNICPNNQAQIPGGKMRWE